MRNDFIMDMIEDFGSLLLNLKEKITQSHSEEFSVVNHDENLGEAGLFGIMLKRKCAAGEINEAENLLFDELEAQDNPDYFFVAIDFYKELSTYDDEKLLSCNFTREEIVSGMKEVIALAEEKGISKEQL